MKIQAGSRLRGLRIVALLAALLPGWSAAQAPAFECGYAVESGMDARGFADAYLSARNERDELALRSFLAKNIVYRDATAGQTMEGIEAVLGYMQQQVRTHPDLRWNTTDVICENASRLVIRWLSWRTVEGRKFEAEGVSILNLVGGRIVTHTDFYQNSR